MIMQLFLQDPRQDSNSGFKFRIQIQEHECMYLVQHQTLPLTQLCCQGFHHIIRRC